MWRSQYAYGSHNVGSLKEITIVATIGVLPADQQRQCTFISSVFCFAEAMLAEHEAEFELGRRYLANMMGANPENFTQEEIDVCIES